MEEKEGIKRKELLLPKKNFLKQSVIFGLVNDYSDPDHIPYKDKMFLTPTEKYRIYGKFPVRMILDIILVILTTIQIVMINGHTSSYTRAFERFLNEMFLQNETPYDVEYPKIKYLYTMDQIVSHVQQSRNDFFNLGNLSIGNLTMEKPDIDTKILVIINYLYN